MKADEISLKVIIMASYNQKFKTREGYIKIYKPGHPKARHGFVFEHVLVMETMIGRLVPNGCHFHHRNQKRDDNRTENLLLTQNGEIHKVIHNALDGGRLDLVEALESWCFSFMEKLKEGLPVEKCMRAGDTQASTSQKVVVSVRKKLE